MSDEVPTGAELGYASATLARVARMVLGDDIGMELRQTVSPDHDEVSFEFVFTKPAEVARPAYPTEDRP